jgi:hypothetical protein
VFSWRGVSQEADGLVEAKSPRRAFWGTQAPNASGSSAVADDLPLRTKCLDVFSEAFRQAAEKKRLTACAPRSACDYNLIQSASQFKRASRHVPVTNIFDQRNTARSLRCNCKGGGRVA